MIILSITRIYSNEIRSFQTRVQCSSIRGYFTLPNLSTPLHCITQKIFHLSSPQSPPPTHFLVLFLMALKYYTLSLKHFLLTWNLMLLSKFFTIPSFIEASLNFHWSNVLVNLSQIASFKIHVYMFFFRRVIAKITYNLSNLLRTGCSFVEQMH